MCILWYLWLDDKPHHVSVIRGVIRGYTPSPRSHSSPWSQKFWRKARVSANTKILFSIHFHSGNLISVVFAQKFETGSNAQITAFRVSGLVTTYICTYIHMYKHTYVQTYIHMYIHTYVHTYICTYIHMYIHTYVHTSM